MPRPGPRPFECVRRSWHSDRHQPIRGSIIQQLFRLVHENHSPGTKKNREWQEKLPAVVLKSEEIMYSKANSEAEYLNSETLWDRLNDAIDTIIRKDETLETGEFLPPCVEAALNIGCVSVRSSRSQRNTNARSYLTPRNQDSSRNVQRPEVVGQTRVFSEVKNDIRPSFQAAATPLYPSSLGNLPRQMVSCENRPTMYPLYHGFHFQPQMFRGSHENTHKIIDGTPVYHAKTHEPLPSSSSQTGCAERLFSFDNRCENKNSKKEIVPELKECDLSLRLGLVSSNNEKGTTFVDDDDDDSGLRSYKEFSFFPLNSDAEEVEKTVTDVRKRKTEHFLHLDPDFERMKRRGL